MYQGYIGEAGTWTNYIGCSSGSPAVVFSNWGKANSDYLNGWPKYHYGGVGSGWYYYAGGPGADPSYNGTTSEAWNWGVEQAKNFISDVNAHTNANVIDLVVWMDDESSDPAITGGGNGWNSIVTGCSSYSATISPSVDRATIDGFASVISNAASYGYWQDFNLDIGIYSSPDMWNQTFGSSSSGNITYVPEWSSECDQGTLNPIPTSLNGSGTQCYSNDNFQSFGDHTNPDYNDVWQWTDYSSAYGSGDWDQFVIPNIPTFYGYN
jgi:hypothetical protein